VNQSVTNLPDPIIDEAINWLVRLEMSDNTPAARLDFEQWLNKTPQHQLAWERVKQIHTGFTSLPAKPLTQTLETLNQQSIQSGINRRQAVKLLSVTGLLFSSGWIAKQHTPWQRLLADYSTEIGEQDSFALVDGSQLTLNTDSALSAGFGGANRKLNLRRGEMQLYVGADDGFKPTRPLLVKTSAGRINTLDSKFTVRVASSRARVTVQDGWVELLNRQGKKQRVESGESVWLSDKGLFTANSIISPDAWLTGAISGKNIPFGELLDELSRYRLGIIDYAPELKHRLVSGIFQLQDIDTTLKFIAQVQSVELEFRTPYWVVIRPA